MKTYPLESISLEEAIRMQHRLVECMSQEFKGNESLNAGDYGINPENNQPIATGKVEKVLSHFFSTQAAILVRGSGTGSIREALASIAKVGSKILVHKSEIYSTTKTTFDMFGYEKVLADFNNLDDLSKVLSENKDISCALIQYTRQEIQDKYELKEVIACIKKENPKIKIVTDDNYAVMKVRKTGVELGADLSCFSLFKLLGPAGVGLVIGKKDYIERIRKFHYSGGSQVQGSEALDALRSLVFAPTQLAIQAMQIEEIYKRLSEKELDEVEDVVIANAQSKVILVKFKEKIAKDVLRQAGSFGAIPYPVGSESRYEICPMFYRLSGTMRKADKVYEDYWIRINPMKASADTVIRILKNSIERVKYVSRKDN